MKIIKDKQPLIAPSNGTVDHGDWTTENEKIGQDGKGAKKPSGSVCSSESIRFLYSVFVVGLLLLGNGLAIVFSSPLLDEMARETNSTQWVEGFNSCIFQGLIAPSVLIGAIFGSLAISLLADLLALVTSLILTAGLFALGWALIGVSWLTPSPILFRTFILSGRFITGVTFGSIANILSVYIGEITPNMYRAVFLGFTYIIYALGTTMSYLLGTFLTYWICAFIYSAIMAAIVPLLFFIQESPLRTRSIVKNAQKLLNIFRKWKTDGPQRTFPILSLMKRLSVTSVIVVFHVFMGYMVLVQYVGPILNVAGASEWNIPHGVLVALTVGGGDLVGAVLTMIFSSRLNHVVSAFIGAVGVCIGHIGIAVYFILAGELSRQPTETNVTQNTSNHSSLGLSCFFEPAIDGDLGQQYSPIALISIAIIMVMYGAFWMVQPYVITVEIFPDDIRDIGVGITISFMGILQVILSFVFPFVEASLGPALSFFTFAFIAGMAAIVIPCIVPETKGRPMGERGDKFTPKQNLMEFIDSIKGIILWMIPFRK